MSFFKGLGTVVGGGIGFLAGGPAGAMMGAGLGGSLGGFAGGGTDMNVDPNGMALARYAEMRDPNYNFDLFRQMARQAGPSRNDMMAASLATGGSRRAAMTQQAHMGVQARDQAYGAFQSYRLASDQAANQMLGMHFGNEQFRTSHQEGQRQADMNRWNSFSNNLMGAGMHYGSLNPGDPGLGGGGGSWSPQLPPGPLGGIGQLGQAPRAQINY